MNLIKQLDKIADFEIKKFIFSKWGDELFNFESPVCFGTIAFGLAIILNNWSFEF